MKYNIEKILKNMAKDKNDDYKVYWEDAKGDHITEEYLNGKDASEMYNVKRLDTKIKYVELQYDPVEDTELQDRIVLMNTQKHPIRIGLTVFYL